MLTTYADTSRRESLLSILRDISPTADNYLTTNLSVGGPATNTLHEWPVRLISRPTSLTTRIEGISFANADGDTPTRSTNYTQIIARPVFVSGTEEAQNRAVPGSAIEDEKKVKLSLLKADMEFAIVRGAVSSGASGIARTAAAIPAMISTNMTACNSGASLTASGLNDLMQLSWDAVGSAFTANVLLVPMGIKRKISGFTTNVTRFTNEVESLYSNITAYDTDSGMVKIVPHKDVDNTAGSVHVIGIREDLFRIAFLKGREPKYSKLPYAGDGELGMYLTEMTLESLGQAASFKATGYNRNG